MAELAGSLQGTGSESSPVERTPGIQRPAPDTSGGERAAVTISTWPGYSNAPANASLSGHLSAETADKPGEWEIKVGTRRQDRRRLATAAAAQEYRAKAFELMKANVKANLQFAYKLSRLTTPFDFIELSITHARKQFELIMSQTAAFGEFSHAFTTADAQRVATGIEKATGGRKNLGTDVI
jgi:hypothetical protein